MTNATKARICALFIGLFCFSLAAVAQQQCPMGMEIHFNPNDFASLAGNGICHMRLWDTGTAWIELEPSNGGYNWSNLDAMISESNQIGADVLYTFGKVPGWASSNPHDPNCKDKYNDGDCAPPIDVDSGDAYFKAFVTALVQHVGTKISYYEMWNEPYNLPYWDGTPQQLEIMVADAAQIIRSINPKAVIVTPSISVWKNQQVFLQSFLNACQGNVSFDVFGMHDYTWGGPPEKVVSEIQSVQSFQAAMGLQNLPLWGTEGSDKDWSTFTQQEKNDFVARYYTLELNMGSQRHYWYSWDVPTVGELMGTPAATVYATVASWFTGRTPKGCVKTGYNSGYQYVCTLQDTTAHQIAWVTNGSKTINTKVTTYQTTDGVLHSVVGGSITINDSPIFVVQ
jgi:hypothetical protein